MAGTPLLRWAPVGTFKQAFGEAGSVSNNSSLEFYVVSESIGSPKGKGVSSVKWLIELDPGCLYIPD